MHILFLHQNFPGQFRHLAAYLANNPQHKVVGLVEKRNFERQKVGFNVNIQWVPYELSRSAGKQTHKYLTGLEENVLRGQSVVRACLALQKQGFSPKLIIGHAGWGEMLYVKDVFPQAKTVGYFEFFYHGLGSDIDFDPEFPPDFDRRFLLRTRNATQLLTWTGMNWGWSPTQWQRNLFPEDMRSRIKVIHEGVDTQIVKPNPEATFTTPNGVTVRAGDEVLTYVSRSLEPYRGFHAFMRALPEIQRQRPQATILVVGREEQGYGGMPKDGSTWKQTLLKEVGDQLDLSRIHFLGNVSYGDYLRLLQVSRVHVYLTYPFVLSWSLLESLAAGCTVVASATAPVQEAITHEQEGLLVDFFDKYALAEYVVDGLAQPEKYQAMRQRARQKMITHYDLQTVCLPQQLQWLNELMAQ